MNTSQNRRATTGEIRGGTTYAVHLDGNSLRVDFRRVSPLDAVYAAVERGDIDGALDIIYERIDDLMSANEVDVIDAMLQAADLDRLDPTTATALLSATLPMATRLQARGQLGVRLRSWLVSRVPNDEVEQLLSGLI